MSVAHTHALVLSPLGVAERDGWRELRWCLHEGASRIELLHGLPLELAWAASATPERADSVLCATLLHAMRRGLPLRIEGQVSPRLLAGLERLQEIWSRWRPRRYRRIDLQAAEERPSPPPREPERGLFAFSGGVDASFSFYRHLQAAEGRNSLAPGALLMVHGMDIPLERAQWFASALERNRRMVAASGVDVIALRTNTRVLGQPWEDSYGLQLNAAFLLFQGQFGHSLHGSGEPWESLHLPWGSTPLTDGLCSTEAMRHHHHGNAFDRSEKIAWLHAHTGACDWLRVCWQGEQLDRNCGRCEKCVRTMLNFHAMGLPIPAAFPDGLSAARVARLRLDNVIQLQEIRDLYRHLRARYPASDPILRATRGLLRRAELATLARAGRETLHFVLKG